MAMMPQSNPPGDDELELDPALALRIVRDQQLDIETRVGGFVPTIMVAWGIAWLVGFGAVWLSEGAGVLPPVVAWWTFGVLIAAASGLSMWLAIRSGRGMRTEDAFGGTVYGVTWSAGSLAIFVFAAGLFHNGMTRELAAIFFPSAFVLFAGIMYLVAGALWRAVPSIVLGSIVIVIAVAAPFFGAPHNNLFFALAGGGAFLGFGLVARIRMRRHSRRFAAEASHG
jgi:hypothetical protein